MKLNVSKFLFVFLALFVAFAVVMVPAAPAEALWQCGDDAYEPLEVWPQVYATIEQDVPQYHTLPFTLDPAQYLPPYPNPAFPVWDYQYSNDVDWIKIYLYQGTAFNVEANFPGYHTQIKMTHTLSGIYGIPFHSVTGSTGRPVTLKSYAHHTGWQYIRVQNINFAYPNECPHITITLTLPNG